MLDIDPEPEIVASASLSPVSPAPQHTAVPKVLPELQQQAEDPNIVPYEPITLRTASAVMDALAQSSIIPPAEVVEPDADADADADGSDFVYDEELPNTQPHPTEVNAVAGLGDSAGLATTQVTAGTAESLANGLEGAADAISILQRQVNAPLEPAPVMNMITEPEATPSVQHGVPSTIAAFETYAPTIPTTMQADLASAQSDELTPSLPSTVEPSTILPADTTTSQLSGTMADQTVADPSSIPEDDAGMIDVQKLVDQITAQAEQPRSAIAPSVPSVVPSTTQISLGTASLPPRPILTASQDQAQNSGLLPQMPPNGMPVPPPLASAGAPGIAAMPMPNFPPGMPPHNIQPAGFPNVAPPAAGENGPSSGVSGESRAGLQSYDGFLADERKHMAEAKWEKFPDGSRIFIGNLSQERVSKRDVFDVFHVHGHLAQISLKSAYGFVQYHSTHAAQSAMDALQGAEIKGRKINLEISRTQKRGGRDREGSPDRKARDRGRNDRADRYDGRDSDMTRRGRDDYRPGRSPSPRRDGGRDRGGRDGYARDRMRSQSPDRYGRNGMDSYRRRSPSPRGRQQQSDSVDQLDIPRRYGADVPDVQVLLLQEVAREFVDWVQRAFWDQRLKVNIMFLHPRYPRDAVIRRQVLEGVHGVVELDARTQHNSKIPLQVFNRAGGNDNVRFDQYQDLDPPIAAQLVLRAKNTPVAAPAYQPPPYAQQPAYGQPPRGAQYPMQYPPQQAPAPAPAAAQPDLSSLVGRLDNNTLQSLIASLQAGQPAQPPPAQQPMPHAQQHAAAASAANSQIDVNALLRSLGAGQPGGAGPVPAPPQPVMPQAYGGAPNGQYGGGPAAAQQGGQNGGDSAQQVQNIMAQLARIRQ